MNYGYYGTPPTSAQELINAGWSAEQEIAEIATEKQLEKERAIRQLQTLSFILYPIGVGFAGYKIGEKYEMEIPAALIGAYLPFLIRGNYAMFGGANFSFTRGLTEYFYTLSKISETKEPETT